MPHGPQRTYREVPFQRAAPPAWEAALNAAPAPKAAPAPLPAVYAAPAPAAGAGAAGAGFGATDKKLQFTRPVSQQSPSKPAPINTAYAFGDTKTTSAVHGSELHVSPHGTVRSFRGATAPSATLKSLNGEVLGVPTQMAPVQHSLPTSGPLRSGDVILVDSEPLTKWDLGPQNRMRPITFKPNGSFATLKQMGKLSGTSFHQSRPSALKLEKESYIPGYTGFIRGKQHIAGRTYGETTRRALSRDYRETVCTSPVPSNPTANRKVFHFREDESFVSNTFAAKTYHVPGYTGFVPGVRQTFSKSYGATTSSELQKHYTQHGTHRVPRNDSGFAETHRTRNALPLDSAPLPGGIKTHKPPEKLVPAHLKDVRFLAY